MSSTMENNTVKRMRGNDRTLDTLGITDDDVDPNSQLFEEMSSIASSTSNRFDSTDENDEGLKISQKRSRAAPDVMSFDENPHGPKRVVVSPKKEEKRQKILRSYPVCANTEASGKIISQIKNLYKNKVKPIEQKFGLYKFCLPTDGEIQDAEFDAKPIVLLIGQYSTGKTTFVRNLVGGDFPGMHIGPEPTTDKFMALVHGEDDDCESEDESANNEKLWDDEDGDNDVSSSPHGLVKGWKNDGKNRNQTGKILKGNSVTVTPELPFASLANFGAGFLTHFVGSVSDAPLLKHITLIDTPGILSGEKQRLSRSYDFAQATKWFADRSDLILLLFDAHKLDISDELKDVIETIRPQNDDKMRCVLNKADGVTKEQLVRVYGSLMWSMGKIFKSPEVVRVYTGSYWDEPLLHCDFKSMFESDEWLLIHELINLPKSCAERKVNELVKRIRMIKVNACILTFLKKRSPRWFGKASSRKNLLRNLKEVFDLVRSEYKLSKGDMPDVHEFRERLGHVEDFSKFTSIDEKTLKDLDDIILIEIPNIMKGAVSNPLNNKSKKKGKRRQDGKNAENKDINDASSGENQKEKTSKKITFAGILRNILYKMMVCILYIFALSLLWAFTPNILVSYVKSVSGLFKVYVFDDIPSNDELV